jgi:hypothetical protein
VGDEFLVGSADQERDEKYDAYEREIFTPRYALRLILDAIIRNHKDRRRSNEARLEDALIALLGSDVGTTEKSTVIETGTPEKHPGGRKKLVKKDLLDVVAREYLLDTYGFSHKKRTMTDIYYDAMAEVYPNFRDLNQRELDTIRRGLDRKFEAGEVRDRVMIEYTGRANYEARRYIDLTSQILRLLAALGFTGQRA